MAKLSSSSEVKGSLAPEERPTMKQLLDMMRIKDIDIATRWRDLGLELVDSNKVLKVIEADHPNDVNTCCRVMFEAWLEKIPDACWNQLVTALNNIEMNTAADAVSKLFKTDSGSGSVLTTMQDIEIGFSIMTNRIKKALINNGVEVFPLIEHLSTMSAVKSKNVPLDIFQITSIDELWRKLNRFWNIFDFDLLECILKLSDCKEAIKIFEDFFSRINPSEIEDADLVLHCRVDNHQGSIWPVLRIMINAKQITVDIKERVTKIVSKKFDLNQYSLRLKCFPNYSTINPQTTTNDTVNLPTRSIDKHKLKLEILQSLSKAREDKCLIKVRYGKVLVCGASAAGKTSFLNLLMEKDFETSHISTKLAESQRVTIAMKAQVFTNDDKIVFTKMNIESEIDQLVQYLPKRYTAPSVQINDERHPHLQLHEGTESKFQNSYTTVENIMCDKLVNNVSVKTEISPTGPYKRIWDVLTFMDTGGQPQFISMLPAVNNFAMITFIVHKMTGGKKSLTTKVMVKHGNSSGKDSFVPCEHEYTYHQLIKTLMSYVNCLLLPNKEFLNEFKEKTSGADNKDIGTSSISFIGTHSNDISENEIKEIDNEYVEMIENSGTENIKPYLNRNYIYLVPIDNKAQEKDFTQPDTKYTSPSDIRVYIHEWLKKQDIYSVPIQWLLLELEIRKVCDDRKCSFITYDEVLQLSKDKELGEDDFIKNGLRFHHLFGVLLYFEEVEGMCELIITDHQWLFDKLTDIVLYSFKDNYDTRLDRINCEKRGIFKEAFLDKLDICADFKKSRIDAKLIIPKRSFLKLLEHLRIIAPLNEDPTKYFMPSLLKSCNLYKVQEKIPGANKFIINKNEVIDSEPLLIQFKSPNESNSFPRGIFCFLVVQLICSTKWELYGQGHDNLLCFIKKDTAHYITVIDRIFFLEVQVTHKIGNTAPIHDEIFDVIVTALVEVVNTLSINTELDYGFWCKECENPKEGHISLLKEYHEYCYCDNEEATVLKPTHKVWFKLSKNSSIKQDDLKGHHTENQALCSSHQSAPTPSILKEEPKILDLINIVIPKVKPYWEILAYSMGYGIYDVKGWERDGKDSHKQCYKLFEDWLTTGRGCTPKTWEKLLERVRAVDELAAAAKVIENELSAKHC